MSLERIELARHNFRLREFTEFEQGNSITGEHKFAQIYFQLRILSFPSMQSPFQADKNQMAPGDTTVGRTPISRQRNALHREPLDGHGRRNLGRVTRADFEPCRMIAGRGGGEFDDNNDALPTAQNAIVWRKSGPVRKP
jgi:hypothetical protein